MQFDVDGARKAGHSDDDIAAFLAKEVGFDLPGARESGYSSKAIVGFLADKIKTADRAEVNAELDVPYRPVSRAVAPKQNAGGGRGMMAEQAGERAAYNAPKKPVATGVMAGYVDPGTPTPGVTESYAPTTPETRAAISNLYNAATPEKRAEIAAGQGFVAQQVTELEQRNALMDARKSPTLERIDPRAEKRASRMVGDGLDPEIANRMAPTQARMGVTPGQEIPGTIGDTKVDFSTRDAFSKTPVLSNPVVRGMAKGGLELVSGFAGVGEAMADLAFGEQKSGRQSSEWIRAKQEAIGEGTGGTARLESVISSLTQQLPYMVGGAWVARGAASAAYRSAITAGADEAAAMAAARAAAGNQGSIASLSGMAVTSFGSEYLNGKNKGLTPGESAARASLLAAFEVIGESFGLGNALRSIERAAGGISGIGALSEFLAANLYRTATREVPGELLTTTGQFLADKLPGIGLNQQAGWDEYLKQMGETVIQTVMQGGITAGGTTGVARAVAYLREGGRTPETPDPYAPQSLFSTPPATPPGSPSAARRPEQQTGNATGLQPVAPQVIQSPEAAAAGLAPIVIPGTPDQNGAVGALTSSAPMLAAIDKATTEVGPVQPGDTSTEREQIPAANVQVAPPQAPAGDPPAPTVTAMPDSFPSKSAASIFIKQNGLQDVIAEKGDAGWMVRPAMRAETPEEATQNDARVQSLNTTFERIGSTERVRAVRGDASEKSTVARVLGEVFGLPQVLVRGIKDNALYLDGVSYINAKISKTGQVIQAAVHEAFHWAAATHPDIAQGYLDAITPYRRAGVLAERAKFENENLKPGERQFPLSAGRGEDFSKVNSAEEEVGADIWGALGMDPVLWQQMRAKDPGLFRAIRYRFLENVTRAINALSKRGVNVGKLVTDLDRVRELTSDAMAAVARRGDAKQSSLGILPVTTDIGKPISATAIPNSAPAAPPSATPAPAPKVKPKKRAKDAFLAFLGDHGVSMAHQKSVTGEVGKKGNRMIQFAGPMFRKNGRALDELALLAVEAGFLTQADIDADTDNGGVNKLTEMIRRAHAGEAVKTVSQLEREFEQSMVEFDEYDTADLDLTPSDYEDAMDGATELQQARIEALTGRLVELLGEGRAEQEIDRIVRVTEGMSQEEYADELERTVEATARIQGSDAGTGASSRQGGAETDQGAHQEFGLEAPTAEGLKAQAAQDDSRRQEQSRRDAAPPADDFLLTGSDRQADRAAAAGQMDLQEDAPRRSKAGEINDGLETKADRTRSLDAQRISARNPTGARRTEDPMGADRLQPGLEAMRPVLRKDGSSGFAHNMGLVAQYPGSPNIRRGTSPDRAAEQFIAHMVENLRWLHNNFDPALRERAKLWYVGANRMAHRWAKKYGFTPEQVAGAMAALSPQKHWFMNVSMAERIMDIVTKHSNRAWSPEMERKAKEILVGKSGKNAVLHSRIRGKTLRQAWALGTTEGAAWVRTFDEAHNDRYVNVITPEGNVGETALGESGLKMQAQWGSFLFIENALSILADGSRENISERLGEMHKVRSFYNNIIAPYSTGGDVTIDTHAVAAALLQPLAGSDREVEHNFGGGLKGEPGTTNSIVNGSQGTYGLYAEAYRRLADELQILPRELQSITWEAVRGLFEARRKTAKLKDGVNAIWGEYHAGRIGDVRARNQISGLVEGFAAPSWAGSDKQLAGAPGAATYAGELPRGGRDGRAAGAGGRGVVAERDSAQSGGVAPRRSKREKDQLSFDYELDPSQAGPAGEAAKRRAVDAVDSLRGTAGILALALSRDLAARQRTTLVGQTVAAPVDLAVLAQVYRDPRFETFRIFFVDGQDRVVSQIGLTQRLPGAVNAVMGDDAYEFANNLMVEARKKGATGFYMLHNHPSGQATPSGADESMTVSYAQQLMPTMKFHGHVVIDTNEFSVIDRNGRSQKHIRDFKQKAPLDRGDWEYWQIKGPNDVMNIAKAIEKDPNAVTLIMTNYQLQVHAVTTIPRASISSNKQATFKAVARATLRNTGSRVFAVSHDMDALLQVRGLVQDGIHISPNGRVSSLRETRAYGGNTPHHKASLRAPRLSPDTSEEFNYLRPVIKSAAPTSRNVPKGATGTLFEPPRRSKVDALGFFSQLERAVDGAPIKAAPAEQWKAWLAGNAAKMGVKAEEIQWSGVLDWLALQTGKVTKDAVVQYLAGNGVQVTETRLGVDPEAALVLADKMKAQGYGIEEEDGEVSYFDQQGDGIGYDGLPPDLQRAVDEASMAGAMPTKYESYTLPGGQNYREMLLTLDQKREKKPLETISIDEALARVRNGLPVAFEDDMSTATIDRTISLTDPNSYYLEQINGGFGRLLAARVDIDGSLIGPDDGPSASRFESGHWNEPNVLAHVRYNERTDVDGKRVLFIEELQSDWAQSGRSKGFRDDARRKAANAERTEIRAKYGGDIRKANEADAARYAELTREFDRLGAAPSAAPFVQKTEAWVALAVKRMIIEAARRDFDKIAFTTGEQNAERYDLSKQVDSVEFVKHSDGTITIEGVRSGDTVVKENTPAEKLDALVGKELAKKIIDSSDTAGEFAGLDLKVGGDGMKSFYNQIVPGVVRDVLKKVGGGAMKTVQIGRVSHRIVETASGFAVVNNATEVTLRMKTREQAEKTLAEVSDPPIPQPGFDITPAMREKVAGGLPRFSKAGGKAPLERDELGRFRFAYGRRLEDTVKALLDPILTRLALKMASPELRKKLRAMKAEIARAQETAVEVAESMKAMPTDQAEMISDIIEQELVAGTVPPAELVTIATRIGVAMEAQTNELVRLGMISQEAADRWRGRYLPRFYESKLSKRIDPWMQAVMMAIRRPKSMQGIRGNNLKARGLPLETIDVADLSSWLADGWEIRDENYVAGTSDRVTVWRDYTREEREEMGEIRDARFRFVMGYMAAQKDIALGRLFEKIAADTADTGPHPGWVKVPSTKVEETGVNRFGKLSGMWVPKEVFDHLAKYDDTGANHELLLMYRKALGLWKESKTVLNPTAHANNVFGNVTMAHFAGVSYWDVRKYAGTVRDLVKDAPMVREARDAGLFLSTMGKDEIVQALPESLRLLADMQESSLEKGGRRVWNALALWLRKPMGAAYAGEDLFFRYMIYREARGRGLEPEDAVNYAADFIFEYDDLPKGAMAIRDTFLPFFSWTYKAIPAMFTTVTNYPWRFAAPAVAMYAVNAAMYAFAFGEKDDDWWQKIGRYVTDSDFRDKVRAQEKSERANLPPWLKGNSFTLGLPKAIRLGMDELTQLPVFMDISRMFPAGDLLDANSNAGGVPWLQSLTPSNPVFTTLSAIFVNRDLWTGRDVVDKNDTSAEAATKRAEWVWKQFTPAIAFGNYQLDRMLDTVARAAGTEIPGMFRDHTGVGKDKLPVQPLYTIENTFGIKARPYDLEQSRQIEEGQKKSLIRSLEYEIKRTQRYVNSGVMSFREASKQIETDRAKIQNLKQGLTLEGAEKD